MPPSARHPRTGRPVGPACLMGACFGCVCTIDGRPGSQACLEPRARRPGGRARPRVTGAETVDVVVVGAGPAGLAAADADERAGPERAADRRAARPGRPGLARRRGRRGAPSASSRGPTSATPPAAAIVDASAPGGTVSVAWLGSHADGRGLRETAVRALVIATGATERPVLFPGATLPGVMGVGAVQAALKQSGIVPVGPGVVLCGAGAAPAPGAGADPGRRGLGGRGARPRPAGRVARNRAAPARRARLGCAAPRARRLAPLAGRGARAGTAGSSGCTRWATSAWRKWLSESAGGSGGCAAGCSRSTTGSCRRPSSAGSWASITVGSRDRRPSRRSWTPTAARARASGSPATAPGSRARRSPRSRGGSPGSTSRGVLAGAGAEREMAVLRRRARRRGPARTYLDRFARPAAGPAPRGRRHDPVPLRGGEPGRGAPRSRGRRRGPEPGQGLHALRHGGVPGPAPAPTRSRESSRPRPGPPRRRWARCGFGRR